jgi:hypothetical protein
MVGRSVVLVFVCRLWERSSAATRRCELRENETDGRMRENEEKPKQDLKAQATFFEDFKSDTY